MKGVSPRYRLGEVLGTGGMAEVLAADDLLLHRGVAVKRLRPELARSPQARARFAAEARAAARLSHPNIVSVFDIGEADGNPFIVMERLPGGSLADLIAAGPLAEEEAVRIAGQVLSALSAAHAAGIVHGDVKPANVLLGEDGTAKVADFGIAWSADQDATAADVIVGTPAYLAPERTEGRRATPASDVFSVGALLYEALAGVPPFAGGAPSAVASATREGRFAPLESRRPGVSPAVAGAVRRALAPDQADRFDTAGAMAKALGVGAAGALARPTARSAGLSGPPTQVLERRTARVAAVTSAGTRRGRPLPLSRRALALGAVGLLAFVLAAGIAVGLGSKPSTAGHPAAESTTARVRPRTGPATAPTTTSSTTTPTTTPPSTPTAVLADNPAPAPTTTTAPAPTTTTTTTPPTPTTTTTPAPTPPGGPPSGAPGQGGAGAPGTGAASAGPTAPSGSAGAGSGQ